ncbi:MAG: hypothetical protein GX811_08385 [Lentisphaerae bacterium]|nr:hypothetical protein [Lentisphaerota bacterium]
MMTEARMNFDWQKQFELALDGKTAKNRYISGLASEDNAINADHCSMCSKDFCALLATKQIQEKLEM